MVTVSRVQLGARVDRVLYSKFADMCHGEKLRLREAVEALMRAALDSGGVARVALVVSGSDEKDLRFREVRFRSMLNDLEKSVEADVKILDSTGKGNSASSVHSLLGKLYDLAVKVHDEGLLQKFEELVESADRLNEKEMDAYVKRRIEGAKEWAEESEEPED